MSEEAETELRKNEEIKTNMKICNKEMSSKCHLCKYRNYSNKRRPQTSAALFGWILKLAPPSNKPRNKTQAKAIAVSMVCCSSK